MSGHHSDFLKKALIALLTALCALLALSMGTGPEHTAPEEFSPPIEKGPVVESIYGIGTVAANRSFELKPGVITTIRSVFVKEGDVVKRGQKLVELDGSVVVEAPFDGTVTFLPFEAGENVFTQTPVLRVEDQLDRYVTVSLEQRAAIRVERGQSARLSFENMRDTAFDGTVESVYSHQGSFLVRIEARGLPPQILPGMTADVAITIRKHAEALLIPVSALHDGKVSVKRGNRTVSIPVKTGLVDGAMAEVVSGELDSGDRLQLPVRAKP